MDFNKLLNEYATEEMTPEELNERADNLAKALITNTQSYGLTPTAVSYTGFERQAGIQPSSSVASKDLNDLKDQLNRNSLDPLIKNPKLSFREVRSAFQQRFSAGSYFNKEREEFSDEVRKILREKPAEYDEIAKKKFAEKQPVFDESIPKKIIQKVVQDVANSFPSFDIEYDFGEREHIEHFKNRVEYLTKGAVTIRARTANQQERGTLTTKLKNKIMEILTKEINDEDLLKEFQNKKDWSSLILSAFDKCEKIINSPENIEKVATSLEQIIMNAAINKNDFTVIGKKKSLKIEIKGPSSSKTGQFKLLELGILSTHKRSAQDLQNVLLKKGITPEKYNNLVTNLYNTYIEKIAAGREIELPSPIYIYLAGTADDKVYIINYLNITFTGKASKFIRATISNNKKSTESLGNLLRGLG